ncbi:AAA family ATPase [Polyangium sp. y55x31]|uniref:AAA family ATPase n=1 Tax=Polyangium sp. y55x31 TaxID=3042688 RepID=UPI002482CB4E|nr:AAA family ATPase [Polyangium sp. y55x31]MDI1484379.1 AAA family ATPase [Polyangium sp. y55x31]
MGAQNPYPWFQHDGLCRALHDPALWGTLIRDIAWRHHFKRVIKRRSVRDNHTINVTDDGQFGTQFLKVLASRGGREELAREFERNQHKKKPPIKLNVYIAKELHYLLCTKHGEQILGWTDSCDFRQGVYYLNIEKFTAWLARLAPDGEDSVKLVVLYGCAFALLQPELAHEIRDALHARGDTFRAWANAYATGTDDGDLNEPEATHAKLPAPPASKLSIAEAPIPEPPHTKTPASNKIPAPRPSQPFTAETRTSEPPHTKTPASTSEPTHSKIPAPRPSQPLTAETRTSEPPHTKTPASPTTSTTAVHDLLRTLSDLESTSSLSIGDVRHCVQLLRERADRFEWQLRAVEDHCLRVNRQLEEAKKLPWLATPLETPGSLYVPELDTIAKATDNFAHLEQHVARLLQAHVQLEALTQRLGREPGPIVPRNIKTLDAVTDFIEARVEYTKDELRRINARESCVSAFLERISTADRRVAESLVREITKEEIRHFAFFVGNANPCTDAGRRYSNIAESIGILGPLLAYLILRTSGIEASSTLSEIFGTSDRLSRMQRAEVLSYLTFAELRELSEEHPSLTPEICEGLFAAAIASNKPELLSFIEPLLSSPGLHPTCEDVYRAAVHDWRRGLLVDLAAQLRPIFGQAPATVPADNSKEAKRHLLDLIQNTPGMTGNFHRLRQVARIRFFLPLKDLIEQGDVGEAVRQWEMHGSLDDMVEQCVRSAKHLGIVDHVHRQQTRNYLGAFESGILQWRNSQFTQSSERLETTKSLDVLRLESSCGRSPQGAALLSTIERVLLNPSASEHPREDFGQRCEVGPEGERLLRASLGAVSPLLTWSFPQAAAEGVVPLWRLIADTLRSALGAGPRTLEAAIGEYLNANQLLAARSAALGNAELERFVAEEIEKKRASIRSENAELLANAQAARVHDEYIDLGLLEVEEALNALEFQDATERLRELDALVRRYHLERDPKRQPLVELLTEAGRTPPAEASTDQLEQLVEALRSEYQYSRLHLHSLREAADDPALPPFFREAWSAAARRLDRPALWPNGDQSLELAESVETIVRFMKTRLRHREVEPAQVDILVESLAEWTPARMKEALERKTRSPIVELANEIKSFCPIQRVLQLLGEAAGSVAPIAPQGSWQSDGIEWVRQRVPRGAWLRNELVKQATPEATNIVSEMRAFFRERAESEPAPAVAARRETLRDVMRKRDWQSAQRIAGELVLGRSESEGQRLSEAETAYAVCLAHGSVAEERSRRAELLHYACLATLDTRDIHYYVTSNTIDEMVARAVLVAGAADEEAHLSESLARVLASIADATSSSPAYQWLSDLMSAAGSFTNAEGVLGSARLALQLWEVLKGYKDVAKPRCDLLYALYRMRQIDTLKYLARTAKPLDDLIVACITAFARAESDPEVRGRTSQIAAAVRDQARGKPNTKPWTLLLARIEPASAEGGALRCTIDADRAEEETDGTVVIPLRLVPPASDPPEIIELEVGGEQASTPGARPTRILLEDEILLKEKILPVPIPRLATRASAEQLEIPYRITGKTINGNKIDVRGSWSVRPAKAGEFTPIREEELKHAWPGASGAPVTGSGSFFGRERELKAIQSHIRANDRQESVMLFGQRRIGKTSLLLQLVSELPPRPGAVVAAYLDVSALDPQPGAIAKSFFNMIVGALDNDPRNEPIRKELQRHTRDITVKSLARGLDPSTSLYYALDGLVQKLAHHSRNVMSRLALFVDEFDRFVEPLLAGQKGEVDKFMWELRKIIQQSPSLALVLAGSGIQRLFVDDYEAALFGSINEVEIGPFNWENDRDAIERTFMPHSIRRQMCRDDVWDDVARYAYELSGGHPYYLAMLGFSAAIVLNGRGLTPHQLNRVVEDMIGGRVRSLGWKINASRFYAPIFETLKRVSTRTRAIAKILLTQIAQRTTPEYPWLLLTDAIDASELRAVGDARRLDALKALDSEGALEIDRGAGIPRVRIRVPLTAAAVREDAVLIRQGASSELRAHEER